jgi:hypothetical protein
LVCLKAIQQAVLVIVTASVEKERSDIRVRQAEGIEAAKRKGTNLVGLQKPFQKNRMNIIFNGRIFYKKVNEMIN